MKILRCAQNDVIEIVILNPSTVTLSLSPHVILNEVKDLVLLRIGSVKDLSQNDPLPKIRLRRLAHSALLEWLP